MESNTITPNSAISPLATEYLTSSLTSKSQKVYHRQGFTAKGIDKVKVLTGLGKNQKSVNAKIEDFKEGKIDYDSVDKYIKDYQYAQRDASELVLDTLTGLSSFGAYSIVRKGTIFASPFLGKFSKQIDKVSKPAAVGLAVLTGMSTKPVLRFFDRIYLTRKEKKIIKHFGRIT